ncbi:MAG: hypothetical protein JW871_00225 [Endomicrobiales bacterium]|nr:hypothetical protein [Endomicrobiales bacterium]
MEIKLGVIEDYFAKVGVVAVKIEESISVGDTIHVKGHTTDLTQTLESMQVEHKSITTAKSGDDVGIKVKDRVRKGDTIYKVVADK